jgi:hypothetical protein
MGNANFKITCGGAKALTGIATAQYHAAGDGDQTDRQQGREHRARRTAQRSPCGQYSKNERTSQGRKAIARVSNQHGVAGQRQKSRSSPKQQPVATAGKFDDDEGTRHRKKTLNVGPPLVHYREGAGDTVIGREVEKTDHCQSLQKHN